MFQFAFELIVPDVSNGRKKQKQNICSSSFQLEAKHRTNAQFAFEVTNLTFSFATLIWMASACTTERLVIPFYDVCEPKYVSSNIANGRSHRGPIECTVICVARIGQLE